MKAIVTFAAGLILVSTTFAQSSRRSEVKENDNQNNRRSETTVSSERRAPSQSRTEVSSTNRRGSESSSTEKKAEATTDNQRSSGTTVNTERRAPSQSSDSRTEMSNTNRRSSEPVTEQRTVVGSNNPSAPSNTGTQDRSSVTNRRNPSSDNRSNGYNENNNSKPSTSSTRTYSNNRREPSGNRDQVIVQEHSRRTVEPRHHTVVHKSYRPVPVEVRRVKYPYRPPVRTEIIWTVDLSRRFEVYYPAYRPYRYHVGMRLSTISAYDAYNFVGEIARVYGRVAETYYSWETDEYFLYVGDYYPYQDFSVVIPGREARDFSRRPERYFDNEYIEVTGLITRFEGKPEMIIKRSSQVSVY